MREAAKDRDFKYHWRCKRKLITNLCFADDLFVFCAGLPSSVKVVIHTMLKFSGWSGLFPNYQKSVIFFSNVPNCDRDFLLQLSGFSEGNFPIKYLGVPLVASRLKASHCSELVEKITKRVLNWTSHWLSYAGRLQLINSVLFYMQVYWSSISLLPKEVIYDIESVLRRFFLERYRPFCWGRKSCLV